MVGNSYNACYSSYQQQHHQHIPAAHGSVGQQSFLTEQLSQAANGGVGSHHYVPAVGVYSGVRSKSISSVATSARRSSVKQHNHHLQQQQQRE